MPVPTQDPLALIGGGDFASASTALQSRLAVDPSNASDWALLASCRAALSDDPGAVECARQALALDRFQPRALTILGGVLSSFGHWNEAKTHLDQALALAPNMPSARWNRAHVNLALQNWREGFHDYEYGKVNGHRPVRSTGWEWRGEVAPGETLLLWAEQGIGDTVMFSRFINDAARLFGGRVAVEWHKPLLRWGQLNFPGLTHYVKTPEGFDPEPFEYEASICSLPFILGEDPRQSPCIKRLAEPVKGRVGFAWQGSRTNPRDGLRSLTKDQASLMAGIANYSLQVGEEPPFSMDTPQYGDVLALARACASCEVVVSVDSAVAHVAASMGVPVLLVASLDPEWRWGVSGPETPWYGSVTVFRPCDFGHSFEKTLEAVKAALTDTYGIRPDRLADSGQCVRPCHERQCDPGARRRVAPRPIVRGRGGEAAAKEDQPPVHDGHGRPGL